MFGKSGSMLLRRKLRQHEFMQENFNPERANVHDLMIFARKLQRQGFIFAAEHWRAVVQSKWGN